MRLHTLTIRLALLCVLAVGFTGCRQHPDDIGMGTPQPVAIVTPGGAIVPVPGEIATSHPTLITAWRGRDPSQLQALFAEDAVIITPEGTFKGWTEFQTGWLNQNLEYMSDFDVQPTSFTRDGDRIIERGTITYKVVPRTGSSRTVNTTYIQQWHPQAGGTVNVGALSIGGAGRAQ